MKITQIFVVMALLLLLTATAVMANPSDVPQDNEGFKLECQNFYGDTSFYTIEKFSFDAEKGNYLSEEKSGLYGYYIYDVTGDLQSVDWSTRYNYHSALIKTGNDVVAIQPERLGHSGGSWIGTYNSTNSSDKAHDISHVTFCGQRASTRSASSLDDSGHGVPEFPTATVGLVLLMGTLGIVVLRKK